MDLVSGSSSIYSSDMSSTPTIIQHSLKTQPSLLSKQSILRISSLDSLLQAKELERNQPVSSQSSQRSILTNINEKEKAAESPKMFRSTAAEVGFCLSMALTQLLAEYLISGFSVLLPTIMKQFSSTTTTGSDFWPASILSLILCSTILTFARVSDMYGGYPVFMTAVLWLFIWTLIAGFATDSLILLNVCRAMQGLAIAAYTPSTFALFGAIYPAGPRRNLALGIYGAMAPLGFFTGICISAALPSDQWPWYFFVAAILAFLSLVMAYLSVPSDRADRPSLKLSMDWAGSVTITSGLILVAYALASSASSTTSWTTLPILLPFILGMVCLVAAVIIETRFAASPLLPLDFFTPKSVKPFAVACLFFYGCFGTWLFTSTPYLQAAYSAYGIKLAAYFTPMAVGGFLIATTSGVLLHRIPPTILLLISGCAWIAAPLLLALGKKSLGYWAFPFPSMICGTLGIDLTFTISVVFLSSVQPLRYQGLAGAVSSILVNVGIAFSLAFAQIVENTISDDAGSDESANEVVEKASKAAFLFAAGSAAVGFVIAVLFVRISRDTVDEEKKEEGDVEAGSVVEGVSAETSRSASPELMAESFPPTALLQKPSMPAVQCGFVATVAVHER